MLKQFALQLTKNFSVADFKHGDLHALKKYWTTGKLEAC